MTPPVDFENDNKENRRSSKQRTKPSLKMPDDVSVYTQALNQVSPGSLNSPKSPVSGWRYPPTSC